MRLDVVIPTYNRCVLLEKAVQSVFKANIPETLQVRVLVVDNNSTDNTRQLVQELQQDAPLPLLYVFEKAQGSSFARNAGIRAGDSDLIGFIDDDETMEPDWLQVVAREFQDPETHYIGGPCLPDWQVPPPDWLPPGYHSVIGAIPPKPRGRYGPGHPGMLNGGNAVVKRSVFQAVGLYSTYLGRTATGLLSEEDAELFQRIQAASIPGMYVPELVILHHVPADRLTRAYHRRWAFWRAVSQGVLDRRSPESVTYLFNVPRHRWGYALRSLLRLPLDRLRSGKKRAFADELAGWGLAGFLYGRFVFRPKAEQEHNSEKPGQPVAS